MSLLDWTHTRIRRVYLNKLTDLAALQHRSISKQLELLIEQELEKLK